ncbi:hypothetical protein J6590_076028 [Homalodisca vitripennis]|nr:hypothetical protein J6590_076028 [Homalodisca vitripennis]
MSNHETAYLEISDAKPQVENKNLEEVAIENENVDITVVEDIESVNTILKEGGILLYTEPSTSTGTNENDVVRQDNSNPKPSKEVNKVRRKEKIPSVATSAQWVAYHKKKEDKKKDEERKKKERMLKRQIKKEDNERKTTTKKSKVTDYICMKCNASWNNEKKQNIKNTWIDCDSCNKSVAYI